MIFFWCTFSSKLFYAGEDESLFNSDYILACLVKTVMHLSSLLLLVNDVLLSEGIFGGAASEHFIPTVFFF